MKSTIKYDWRRTAMRFISFIEAIWKDRTLRHKCLNELLDAVVREGIEFSQCYITSHKIDPPDNGVDNLARRKLEDLKNNGKKYSIEVITITIKEKITQYSDDSETATWESISPNPPHDFYIVGKTLQDRNYKLELQSYHNEVKMLEDKGLIRKLPIHEDINYGLNTNRPDTFDGGCPKCFGYGVINCPSGGFEVLQLGEKCPVCGGTGVVNEQTSREYYQEEEFDRLFRTANRERFQQIIALQSENEKLLRPKEESYVYVRFLPVISKEEKNRQGNT